MDRMLSGVVHNRIRHIWMLAESEVMVVWDKGCMSGRHSIYIRHDRDQGSWYTRVKLCRRLGEGAGEPI
jgi:hypothetical protein